jgi:hypothetical protein
MRSGQYLSAFSVRWSPGALAARFRMGNSGPAAMSFAACSKEAGADPRRNHRARPRARAEEEAAAAVAPFIAEAQAAGAKSLRQIAAALNAQRLAGVTEIIGVRRPQHPPAPSVGAQEVWTRFPHPFDPLDP